jgi:hypothetical protein
MVEKNLNVLQLSERTNIASDAIMMILGRNGRKRQIITELAQALEIEPRELLFEAGLLEEDLEKYVKDQDSGLKLVKTLLEADLSDEQLRELIEMIKKEPVAN